MPQRKNRATEIFEGVLAAGNFKADDGYGLLARALIEGLTKEKVQLEPHPDDKPDEGGEA